MLAISSLRVFDTSTMKVRGHWILCQITLLENVLKKRISIGFVVGLSLLSPATGQQQEKPKDEVVRVTTNLVQVDVVVTDKDGNQIADLRPQEFEILEDGKAQTITNFSYIEAGKPISSIVATNRDSADSRKDRAPVAPAPLARAQVQRTIALVIDDLGLSFESVSFVGQALKRFVDEQMQPGDLVAILRTSAGVSALQQFTSDKRLLNAAIERVRWNPQGRGGLSPFPTLNEASAGADTRDSIQFMKEAEEERAALYSVGTFGSMSPIIKGLGDMPGRKSLVLISEACRLFTTQGRNIQLIQAMRRLTDQANAASVSIYTIDASGLQPDALQAADQPGAPAYMISPQLFAMTGGETNAVATNAAPRTLQRADTLSAQAQRDSGDAFRRLGSLMEQRQDARVQSHTVLSYLADGTGGLFMRNRNDLSLAMERIIGHQKGYYLIGYRPAQPPLDPASGARQRHVLTVKIKRSGATWRARSAYFGMSDEAQRLKPQTRSEQLTAALLSPFASDAMRLRLTTLFGDEPNGGTYLRSLLHIDARDVLFKQEADGSRLADLEIVAVAFGDSGQIVDQLSYPQSVRVGSTQEYERLLESGLIYILNFPIKRPGAYQMRVAVRDSFSERVGAAMQFVEVADLQTNHLTLSGIVLNGKSANVSNSSAAEPDPQAGPAVRRLHQGMVLEYRYNVYNAKLDGGGRPQIHTQMRLFRAGQPVFTGRLLPLDTSKQSDMRRLNAAGGVLVGPELVPGEYVVQITVTDSLAAERYRTATQWIDFEIVK